VTISKTQQTLLKSSSNIGNYIDISDKFPTYTTTSFAVQIVKYLDSQYGVRKSEFTKCKNLIEKFVFLIGN